MAMESAPGGTGMKSRLRWECFFAGAGLMPFISGLLTRNAMLVTFGVVCWVMAAIWAIRHQ